MPQAAGSTSLKPFSFSWSRLKNYRTTAQKRHYEIDLAKNYKDADSEALKWGNQVHEAMAKYIGQGLDLPTIMKRYKQWPEFVVDLSRKGTNVKVEQKMAIGKDFPGVQLLCPGCVVQGSGGCDRHFHPHGKKVGTIDWKTGGKVSPEFEQLAMSAQTIFAHYPNVEEVARVSIYVWFGHDDGHGDIVTTTKKIYRRGGHGEGVERLMADDQRNGQRLEDDDVSSQAVRDCPRGLLPCNQLPVPWKGDPCG